MNVVRNVASRAFGVVDALAVGTTIAAVAAWLFPPQGFIWWACPFRLATGLPCPGCGLTRAAVQLAHGHPFAAFALHPLGTVVYACLGVVAVAALVSRLMGWGELQFHWSERERRWSPWVVALALGLNYAYTLGRALLTRG